MGSFLNTKGLGDKVDDLAMVKTLVVFLNVTTDNKYFVVKGDAFWFFFNNGFNITQGLSRFEGFFDDDLIGVALVKRIVFYVFWGHFDGVAVNGIGC